jgi:uncharacterized protein (DUF983 family)
MDGSAKPIFEHHNRALVASAWLIGAGRDEKPDASHPPPLSRPARQAHMELMEPWLPAPRPYLRSLGRGLAGRCPHCGKARLFYRYLKVEPVCQTCGHDLDRYPADDGPAYFTILIVGHLVVAPLLCLSFVWTWPVAWALAVTLPIVALATLVLLPIVKGGFIGVQWALERQAGSIS